MEFARPVFLWLALLLPLLVIAHYYFLFRTQKKAMRFANFETLKRISGDRLVTRNNTVLIIRTFVFIFAILALSGMTYYYQGQRNDFDYVIAIDTSSSMLTADIKPDRLTVAKNAALTFLDTLDSSTAVGFVTFSGVTYVRNPLSTDYLNMRINIGSLNVSRTSGTDISGAIVTASNLFNNDEVGKAVILFTDGANTVSSFVEDTINEAADYAQKENIVIYAVGLGTDNAKVGYLPELFNLTTNIDRKSLDTLAQRTGGQVIYPADTQELTDFFKTLDQQSTVANIPVNMDRYAVLAMVMLLSIEWILINLTFRRVA